MAEELRKAKGRLNAQKGHFTRNRASVETRLKAVMDEPDNEQAWSVLQKAYERYEKSWEKLDEAFTMVLLVEPDDAEQGHVTLEKGTSSPSLNKQLQNSPKLPTSGRRSNKEMPTREEQTAELEVLPGG